MLDGVPAAGGVSLLVSGWRCPPGDTPPGQRRVGGAIFFLVLSLLGWRTLPVKAVWTESEASWGMLASQVWVHTQASDPTPWVLLRKPLLHAWGYSPWTWGEVNCWTRNWEFRALTVIHLIMGPLLAPRYSFSLTTKDKADDGLCNPGTELLARGDRL